MFGMSGAPDDQPGVAGHIKISWATGPSATSTTSLKMLPALSAPKPSHGPFYLRPTGNTGTHWPDESVSLADANVEIAGRKYYLHPPENRPLPARGNTPESQCKDVNVLPAGTTFTGIIRFDNLSDADLGLLLAALDTRLLEGDGLPWSATAQRIGMGKPLGLGSVQTTITKLTVDDRSLRYQKLGAPVSAVSQTSEQVSRFVEAFRTEANRQHPEDFEGNYLSWWKHVAAAMGTGTVAANRANSFGYPAGNTDPNKSFEWFVKTENRNKALHSALQVAAGKGL
jgi:CRISPR-associated protein (TIGR03986 family)